MNYFKNPFNYTGAKYKLLEQLHTLFPKNIDLFIDLFGGSGEVFINSNANNYIYNEKNKDMSNLIKILSNKNTNYNFIDELEYLINKYKLNKTSKEEFLQLRTDFNSLDLREREREQLCFML